jgi:hypothetical protein
MPLVVSDQRAISFVFAVHLPRSVSIQELQP